MKGIATAVARQKQMTDGYTAANCEVASMIARRLGLPESVHRALLHIYAWWNRKGRPRRCRCPATAWPAMLSPRLPERGKERAVGELQGAEQAGGPAVRRGVPDHWGCCLLVELVAPDLVHHSAILGMPPGRPGSRSCSGCSGQAFPDFRAEILDELAEGDRVHHQQGLPGDSPGRVYGIPATGNPVQFELIDIVRVRDGRIVEDWNVVDQFGLTRQLGAIPA
jgi:predicted ester cyclase